MTDTLSNWLMLILTLPSAHAAVRIRVWRALKNVGCGIVRDGVYLLPEHAEQAELLPSLAEQVLQEGGSAHLLRTTSSNSSQERQLRALFARTEEFAQLLQEIQNSFTNLPTLSASALQKLSKRMQRNFTELKRIDYFPDSSQQQTATALLALQQSIERILTPGEPGSIQGAILPLQRSSYQGRVWATRQSLWIDRLASAWLIRRFIDPQATFLWLSDPSLCPEEAVGFDYDGAAFTHTNGLVTFETLMLSFALEQYPALRQIGHLVHGLDAGGNNIPEAAGLERILDGLRRQNSDDDQLLQEAIHIFDALLQSYSAAESL
ncbi:chromate resistance protein ChrB domain-containing protein [Candidatus Magnetaquicoccus inordinatus]|uniref:chromate resistance protein ChrB domain-containing protein n=1 Tax=Candidatus Magnetaquicoccus inordinatus TaxID=2496818 RepID=UPI00102C8BFE|nr:chromate resistance protein ChrB domain-containing protein [Candidatus Magnetaquicoccus inordinatus]